MKVLLIGGCPTPDVCGVGDYTRQLARSLVAAGVNAELFSAADWRMRNIRSILRLVDTSAPDLIHIQYPAATYGWRLGPQLLSLLRRCTVTLHEVSQAHPVRQLSLFVFLAFARRLIFTTDFELDHACKLAPWARSKSTVIPIGSNVSGPPSRVASREKIIGYFGLIRPNKGLERVLDLARLLAESGSEMKVLIVGAKTQGQHEYFEMLRRSSSQLPVTWRVGLDGPELDETLSQCSLAYLPYPDGVSERRSSLLPFLHAGIPVITTPGAQVSPTLERAVELAPSPELALQIAQRILADGATSADLIARGKAYARSLSWSSIAERHIELYGKIACIQ